MNLTPAMIKDTLRTIAIDKARKANAADFARMFDAGEITWAGDIVMPVTV